MKRFVGVLFVLCFLVAGESAFASDAAVMGISAKDKVVLCIKNPVKCTKVAVVKTGKAVYGAGDKVIRGAWGLTIGKICK
ncbi:MAG: hypothetical protein ACP5OG_02330 [Candidatus Nanoarchaeia archaeon]